MWSCHMYVLYVQEYARYCREDGDSDDAPLYVFDPSLLTRRLASGGGQTTGARTPRLTPCEHSAAPTSELMVQMSLGAAPPLNQ